MIPKKVFITLLAICIPNSVLCQFFENDYVIQDVRNGINWYRCTVGQTWSAEEQQCIGEIIRLNQEEIADALNQASDQLGGTWRLPSVKELESIVCKNCDPPKVNTKYFKGIESEAYWTGTKNFFNSKMYWSVNFMTGHNYTRFLAYQQLPFLIVQDR